MMSRSLLSDLEDVATRLSQTQRKLSSGKELTKPSDDPFLTGQALDFRGELAANQQYQRNVQEADAWQTVTDSALASVRRGLDGVHPHAGAIHRDAAAHVDAVQPHTKR